MTTELAPVSRPLALSPASIRSVLAPCLALCLTLAGCASASLDAQWSDPAFAGRSYGQAPVAVACGSHDLTAQRICEDRMVAELGKLGVAARPARTLPDAPSAANAPAEAYLPAARRATMGALVYTSVAPGAAVYARSGSSVGIGLGGFGGPIGVGIGMSVPIGGARQPDIAWGGNATLIDVGSGRTAWSASATARSSDRTEDQLATLADVLAGAARKAGFL